MFPSRWRPRATTLLGGTAVGVYLLVVVGATSTLADATRACPGWPTCGADVSTPATAVALGHRVVAALVGVLLLATAVAVWRSNAEWRVRTATMAALALYPVQIALGAVLATGGATGSLPGIHLLLATAIFGALVLALAWRLEAETGSKTSPDTGTTVPAAGDVAGGPAGAGRADPDPSGTDRSTPTRLGERVLAYLRLTKPRLMWLLCLVALAGMAVAAGPALELRTVGLTLGGGVLAIGASGTFNHVFERERDRKMARTADRPVTTHLIPVSRAVAFGLALAGLSLAVFLQVNLLTAALGGVAILFYSVVYTLVLKPNTVQNTVIGGAAGALPALIGWAAVTGRVGLPGLALAGLIFVWTPAHFYNLALAYKEDYARGGFPMMPVVRGDAETRKHILLWLAATLLAAGAVLWVTDLGPLVAATTVLLGAVFLVAVLRLHREKTERAALRAFHASNAYLGAVLLAVVVDAAIV